MPEDSYFWDRTFDTGHIAVFGVFALILLLLGRAVLGKRWLVWQYLFVIAFSSAAGLGLEIFQTTVGRDAEWIDLFNDVVGILAVAAVFAVVDDRWPAPRSGYLKPQWLLLTAAIVLLAGFLPYAQVLQVYHRRNAMLPRLVDFSAPNGKVFYYIQDADFEPVAPPEDWPTTAIRPESVARLVAHPARYPGLIMKDLPSDWTGYRHLEIDLLLAEPSPHLFVLRVHDMAHNHKIEDRFRRELKMQPGFQTIQIAIADLEAAPQGRKMDLRRMARFKLYLPGPKKDVTFYVGDIRLVP